MEELAVLGEDAEGGLFVEERCSFGVDLTAGGEEAEALGKAGLVQGVEVDSVVFREVKESVGVDAEAEFEGKAKKREGPLRLPFLGLLPFAGGKRSGRID